MLLSPPYISPPGGPEHAWRGWGGDPRLPLPTWSQAPAPPPVPRPQDVSAERSLELPQLYTVGQKDELFNYWVFLQALAHGMATSLVNFFVPLWVSHDSAGPASFSDHQSFSVVVALSGLLSITMEVGGATGLSPSSGALDVSH